MKEIKFNSDMIEATISGLKNQTRRPIKESVNYKIGEKLQVKDGKGRPVFITGNIPGEYRRAKNFIVNTIFPIKTRPLIIVITGKRTEHLQTITRSDAQREGLERKIRVVNNKAILCYKDYQGGAPKPSPINSFKSLWAKIYGMSSWSANERVYVYTFEILKKD